MLKYPRHLLPLIHRFWQRREQLEPTAGPLFSLPGDQTLLEILSTAYHVSLLTDEKRRCRFRVVFMLKKDLENVTRLLKDRPPIRVFRFSEPRPFTVDELRRLSPATDRWQSLIFVQIEERPDGPADLQIVGVVDKGFTSWGIRFRNTSPPPFLMISSTEPGHLAVGQGRESFLVLRKGKIFRPSMEYLREGPISEFFRDSHEELRYQVDLPAAPTEVDPPPVSNLTDTDPPSSMQRAKPKSDLFETIHTHFLVRILFEIRERGHGGALLIVPEACDPGDSRLERILRFKYPGTYENTWNLLQKLSRLSCDEEILTKRCEHLGQGHHDLLHLSQIELHAKRIEDRLTDIIRFISALSGVDGAIIMTDRFRLLGFGAEIIVQSPELTHVLVVESSLRKPLKPQAIESYGTRHRSAFRFCHAMPDSVAFVLSQDGGVKAVKKVGEDVVLWPQVSLMDF